MLPGVTGQQVAANIDASVRAAGVPLRLSTRTTDVRPCKGGIEATLAGPGETTRARPHLVIASGVRAKGLPDHPPGASWPGVLIGPGSPIVAQDYSGLSVAVLGGGDNAFENYVYVRNRARAPCTCPQRARAAAMGTARRPRGRAHRPLPGRSAARSVDGRQYDLILVFYGWEPQAGFADDLRLARDERGYIRTDFATAETSVPDIYAIGEVAHRMHPCVVTSMADGVVAAKAIQRRWERAGE